MEIEFDPSKNEHNFAKHGLFLAAFTGFDGEFRVVEDNRIDYGEERIRLYGLVGGKPHCVVATVRDGSLRLISFRRARLREYHRYE